MILPNAWDAYSAQKVVAAGFPVVATSSGAVARMLGFADDDSMPADEAFAAVARIGAAVGVPVTADMEAGYRLPPDEFVRRLLAAGAVGCNLEDSEHHGPEALVDPDAHVEYLSAVRAAARVAGVDIVINARVDSIMHGGLSDATLEEAIRRGRLYREAGADCVYPITLSDRDAIAKFVAAVEAPVNILIDLRHPDIAGLARLGVARLSAGSGLMLLTYARAQEVLAALSGSADPAADPPEGD